MKYLKLLAIFRILTHSYYTMIRITREKSITSITALLILLSFSCSRKHFSELKTSESPPNFPALLYFYKTVARQIQEIPNDTSVFARQNNIQLDLIRDRSTDWTKYHYEKLTDTTSIISFEVRKDSLINIVDGSSKDVYYSNKTEMVVFEYARKTNFMFYMVVMEEISQAKRRSYLDGLRYANIPKKFSGQILYFTLNKQFINGVRIRKGHLVGRLDKLFDKNNAAANLKSHKKSDYIYYNIYQGRNELNKLYLGSFYMKGIAPNDKGGYGTLLPIITNQ